MAKSRKTTNPLGYKTLPPAKAYRGGCKVAWQYYETEEVAKQAADIAEHNARIDASQGYDFGYQSPGSITPPRTDLTGEWAKYNGLWEVCTS